MSEIINKISKELADKIGPDAIFEIVSKSIETAVDSYTARSTIERIVEPAIIETATKYIATKECKKIVQTRVLQRINGIIESSVDKTLCQMIKTITK